MAATRLAPTTRTLTVALIGNPNTGKSTLFNALTGLHSRVGNYPGVTVEKKIGRLRVDGIPVQLVDLPGTYSLSPRTLDEMVSVEVLLGRQRDVGPIDAVVCIVDASNLERNLYLFSQLRDLGLPTVLVLNMWDMAQSRGLTIDPAALSRRLGVPVLPCEAHRRKHLHDIRRAILQAAGRPVEDASASAHRLFPAVFYEEAARLRDALVAWGEPDLPEYLIERLLLDAGGQIEHEFLHRHPQLLTELADARQRLQAAGCRIPAMEAKVRYAWARDVLQGIVTRPAQRPVTASDKLDRWLTQRVVGLLVFCAMMFVVFQAIYSWAEPIMGWFEAGQDALGSMVEALMPPGALRSLLIDGVIAGVGGVLVFLPQIALLFLFIALLEDCGYLARAAFLMDKLMTKVGLSGKSFVPLMSSFACAIPGVMATRVIENRRDRMVTILVAPLMSCSARLPVYVLLIGAFIPATRLWGWLPLRGTVLFGMMSLGALVAIPVAWLLKKTFFKGETPPFVMELPAYKWPSPRIVLHRVYDRSKDFVTRAGTLIFATTVVVWALGYFPADHTPLDQVRTDIERAVADPPEELLARQNQLSSELIERSFLGRMGHAIEPVVRPLGWDWRIGVGALASFPAREVIISTLGTIYSLGGEVDEQSQGLAGALRSAEWPDGRPVYTIPVALSIMVFFALCAQCASTLMVIARETNSWRWPLLTFAYMTLLAYVGALATYQIGTWLL